MRFIISLLLMMVCVQTFSMHFHMEQDGDRFHQHAPAHSHLTDSHVTGSHDSGDNLAHHSVIQHDEEMGSDVLGTLIKQSASFDFLIFLVFPLVLINLVRSAYLRSSSDSPEWRDLSFFQPPLRAPPVFSHTSI